MLISSHGSALRRKSRTRQKGLSRAALTLVGVLSMLTASVRTSPAQSPASESGGWELRFTSGALVPTGSQRNVVKDAQMSAAQMSWVLRPSLAITGTLGWARSRDVSSAGRPKLDVFAYDVGVEARPATWFADRAVSFSPFAGLGAGGRSYNYRKLDVGATNNLASYGTVGGEFGVGRLGLRLEARDYVTGFKPLVGAGKSGSRNDVVLMGGLRFNRK